jgi:hypothetical protein
MAIAAAMFSASLAGCVGAIDSTGGAGGASGTAGSGSGAGGGKAAGGGSGGEACVPSGATGGSGAIPPTFATVKLVLGGGGAIMPCASAPCHATGGMEPPDKPLSLQNTSTLYSDMLSYVASDCNNLKLVNPGKPDQSALVSILTGPCGTAPRMPYMCSDDACIPPEYIAAISQWIANCAPEQ